MAETSDRPARNWIGWLQVVALLVLLAVGIYFARAPQIEPLQNTTTTAELPSVRVVVPEIRSNSLTLRLTGEVRPYNVMSIRPETVGRIVEISPSLTAGGTFSAGDTLLVQDPEDAEFALEKSEALLAATKGHLRKFQDKGAYESQKYLLSNPGSEVPPAVQRLGQIERYTALVEAQTIDVQIAKKALADTRLSVPYDGTVIQASITVGEHVTPATIIATVFETGNLEISVPISVLDLKYLGDPRGKQALVLIGGVRYTAVVSQVSSVLTPDTRLSTLFLDFNNQTIATPGSFVSVVIEGPVYEESYLLPPEARREDDSAWVVDHGVLTRVQPRTLGVTDKGWIVSTFNVRDGIVVGVVPKEEEGIEVKPVAEVGS